MPGIGKSNLENFSSRYCSETKIKKIIVGNRKMHGSVEEISHFIRVIYPLLPGDVRVVLCPSFVHIPEAVQLSTELRASYPFKTFFEIGAQDCAFTEKGPYTGDVSSFQLVDIGVKTVILGHSERRLYHFEDNFLVGKKIFSARQAGVTVILCTGEDEEIHQSKATKEFIRRQLTESLLWNKDESFSLMVAYEPLWAIGSGKIPTVEEISEICLFIREFLQEVYGKTFQAKVLYGGSVNEKNAAFVLSAEGVDGVLVGGASLNIESFLEIVRAASFSI